VPRDPRDLACRPATAADLAAVGDVGILSGRLHAPGFEANPAPFFAVSFLFPEWAALDPLKEATADVTLLTPASARARKSSRVVAATSPTLMPKSPPTLSRRAPRRHRRN